MVRSFQNRLGSHVYKNGMLFSSLQLTFPANQAVNVNLNQAQVNETSALTLCYAASDPLPSSLVLCPSSALSLALERLEPEGRDGPARVSPPLALPLFNMTISLSQPFSLLRSAASCSNSPTRPVRSVTVRSKLNALSFFLTRKRAV
jgi:hypothetical protein